MKAKAITTKLVTLLALALLFGFTSRALAYNRESTAEYADRWTEDDPSSTLHNPDYEYYDGNDCANYVSQCLIAGGFDLSAGTDGYGNGVDVDGCIPNCDNLHSHLVDHQHVEHQQISTTDPLPDNLQAGDVIIFGDSDDEWRHAVIVASGSGNNVELNAHTNHRSHRPFSFFANAFPLAHIYHFPTAAETGNAQGYFGTGAFYGERALRVAIYESGENYEGYILTNTDPTEQDMAIGEDTSSYPACSHYVEGYCVDVSKGIPSRGRRFAQPWTCDSPNHWAYWVRRAVEFANDNNYPDYDTLGAVWYITDRATVYNEILSSIEYPEDGPNKNADPSYHIKGRVSMDGDPAGGVTVTLSGGISWTRVTDDAGYYEFLYLPEGDYAITIQNATLTSDPPMREYAPLNANQEDQDFTAVLGATIESCESDGTLKDEFNPSEWVYVFGGGFEPEDVVDIYAVEDVEDWSLIDGAKMATTLTIMDMNSDVQADNNGDIPVTEVWTSTPLTQGKYDILVDVDQDGYYDADVDVLDNDDILISAGFFVIPEYPLGGILGLVMCMAALAVYKHKRVTDPLSS